MKQKQLRLICISYTQCEKREESEVVNYNNEMMNENKLLPNT